MIRIHAERPRGMLLGSYALLLFVLIVYVVVYPALREAGVRASWIADFVFPVILLSTLVGAVERWRPLIVLVALGALALLFDVTLLGPSGAARVVLQCSLRIALLLVVIGIILRHVLRSGDITGDKILGAFCAYLLLGLAWGHGYMILEAVQPDSFLLPDSPLAGGDAFGKQQGPSTYYSFVTLATLGYGDITPVRPLARSLSVLEAVSGQFYIAVIIAYLVAMRITHAISQKESKHPSSTDP